MKSVLIIGLSGSGKTTFSQKLFELLKPNVNLHDADEVRKKFNDWDFSLEGRKRQVFRMKYLSDLDKKNQIYSVCNFICPLSIFRDIFNADILVWMNTIKECKFQDTNDLFESPKTYNFIINSFHEIEDTLIKVKHEILR